MKTLHVTERSAWRSWLKANGGKEKEIWLVFYKKHTGKPRLAYDESVEEALCFGWIDSIVKRLDDERYILKFTPRKKSSNWSDLNIRRAKKMIAAGAMTPAGLARIDLALLKRKPAPRQGERPVPAYIRDRLDADHKAGAFFSTLPPWHRHMCVSWVDSAKKEETKQRRLAELLATLRARRKLGLK